MAVPRVAPSRVAVIVVPEKPSLIVCQLLAPSAAAVPARLGCAAAVCPMQGSNALPATAHVVMPHAAPRSGERERPQALGPAIFRALVSSYISVPGAPRASQSSLRVGAVAARSRL